MYRILIVEDDNATADKLRACIERYAEEHGLEVLATRLASALDLPERAADADLVFLDIELPQINGMDAALELRRHNATTLIIFVTNLAQYAVKGYQANALDFVVKPFTYYDLALRLDRAVQVLQQRGTRRLAVHTREGTRLFSASDLVFLDTQRHDVVYHLADGTTFSVRGSLKGVWDTLGGAPFLRISSGCIINMAHVRGLRDAEVTLSTGDVVWMSRANKKRCLEEITRYLGGTA